MTNKNEVIEIHRNYPTLGTIQVAEKLGCLPEYVRATAKREGLVFPPSPKGYRNGWNDALDEAKRVLGGRADIVLTLNKLRKP